MANITGWGRGTWGQGAWNAPLPVEVTGVAGTTALGSESVLPAITVAVTGVSGTTAVGSESVAASSNTTIDFRDSLMATSFSQEFGLTVDGFVNDGQTISNGSDLEDITNTERAQDIVLAAEMDLPSSFSKASTIWETGGTGSGAWFGISEQSGAYFLRFRAGDGTVGNNTTSNSLAIAQVAVSTLSQYFDGNTHTVIWAIDRDIGKVEIYIDGQLVADGQTSDGSSVAWAGGAAGGFGVASGTPAGGDSDDGSTQFQSGDAFTGTIRSDLRMYKNEFIATQTNSTVTAGATVVETGVAGTGAVGNTVETGTSVVGASGNQGSGQVGDELTRPQGIFGVTGVQGQGSVGTVSAAPQTVVTVTNVAGTAQAGTITETGTALVAPTGVEGTGQLGNEVAFSSVVVVETGLAGTTGLGNVTAAPSIEFAATGLAGTTGLGSVTVLPSITTAVTGQVGTTSLGTATAIPSIEFAATGFAATGSVGDVLAAGGAKVVEDAVTGSVNLGDEAVSGDANLSVTGVSATGGIDTDSTLVSFIVTVVGGNPSNHPYYNQGSTNKYAIGGSTATADVVLDLIEGRTYRFDQSDSSNNGHPINIYEDANKTTAYSSGVTYNIDGSTVSQSQYVDTSTFNAGTTRYVEIVVPIGAPTLFYQCYNHALMGAQLNTESATGTVVTIGLNVSVSGLAGTSALGTALGVPGIQVSVTTVVATMSLGNVTSSGTFNFPVTGVEATTALGTLNLYGIIANEVSVSYTEVVPSQNANYEAA